MRWYSTGNRSAARSGETLAWFRNPKGWIKAIAVRSKKRVIGWIFKQLLGITVLGPTEKNANYATNSVIQVHTQDMSSKYTQNFQTDLGSLAHSYRQNVMQQSLDVGLPFPMSVVAFPKLTLSEEFATEKWPPNKHFQAVCHWLLAYRMLGKLCSFKEWKTSTEIVVPGLYLSGIV